MTNQQVKQAELWVDENMSEQEWAHAAPQLARMNVTWSRLVKINELCPGAPDAAILEKLMATSAMLITKDRPFHNLAHKKGVQSFCLLPDNCVTRKPVKGYGVSPDLPGRSAITPIEKADDLVIMNRRLVNDFTDEKRCKKQRTRRRRIRNKVGGVQNIDHLAVTVTVCEDLIGITAQLCSNCQVKAFRASEAFIRYQGNAIYEAAFIEVLALLHSLHAEEWKINVFYDTGRELPNPKKLKSPLFTHLSHVFTQLNWIEVSKGRHLEMARKAVQRQVREPTNMIVPSEVKLYQQRFSNVASLDS